MSHQLECARSTLKWYMFLLKKKVLFSIAVKFKENGNWWVSGVVSGLPLGYSKKNFEKFQEIKFF